MLLSLRRDLETRMSWLGKACNNVVQRKLLKGHVKLFFSQLSQVTQLHLPPPPCRIQICFLYECSPAWLLLDVVAASLMEESVLVNQVFELFCSSYT